MSIGAMSSFAGVNARFPGLSRDAFHQQLTLFLRLGEG